MIQSEALDKAKRLFGEHAIAIISTDQPKRDDIKPVTRYIIGYEAHGVPIYEGIGSSWEEAFIKCKGDGHVQDTGKAR